MANKKGWKGVNYRGTGSSEEVQGAHDVTAKVQHLDGDYDFHLYNEVKTTDQGLLVVAELKPKVISLPSFSIRWDRKNDHLNADIHGAGKTRERWFRDGKKGYLGHIAQKAAGQVRASDVDIWMPSKHVFKGRLNFGLDYSVTATAKVGVKGDCQGC
jgi:hypothetical protein